MTLRLALIGASGRAGSEVLRALPQYSDIALCSAVVAAGAALVGSLALKGNAGAGDILFSDSIPEAVRGCDVALEFSSAAVSVDLAEQCAASRKPLLVASSGHSPEQRERLRELSNEIPILHAANLSVGVQALQQCAVRAQEILGSDFEIEIHEIHHRNKKDAPSGTALALGRALANDSARDFVLDRNARVGARSRDEIGISSSRGGDVVGEHTVFFFGKGERLELVHRSTDRSVFAHGALRLLPLLARRPAGLYTVADMLFDY